ncbi:uncharacterized protein LKV04_022186 isoform 1-T2 [Tautogolabrus adspersus]
MSHSSDKGDQQKAESAGRTWEEPQPGPSRCQPSRQGYCGYCRVLYSNLDQHLSSLRHLDSVWASSRGSSIVLLRQQNKANPAGALPAGRPAAPPKPLQRPQAVSC